MNKGPFFSLSALLLIATAAAKLYSVGGTAKILEAQDQLLFHLGYRTVVLGIAVVEIGVAVFLFKSRSDVNRSLALLWLSSNFIAYRLGNYLLGIHTCPCLGHLADRLPIPRGLADVILQVLVLWWFAGSITFLWRCWGTAKWAGVASLLPFPKASHRTG